MRNSALRELEELGYTFLNEITSLNGNKEQLWENGEEWILVNEDGIVTWQDSNERYQEAYQ